MKLLKSIIEFLRSKFGTFAVRNTSVEDQYNQAAEKLINEIDKLRRRHVTSEAEVTRLRKLSREKAEQQARKEKEIIHIRRTQPATDVTTHVKLALLYRNSSNQLLVKANELQEMQTQIESAVVTLDDQRRDLAVKLEFIREARNANSLGLDTASDIVESAGLANVDVETILRRVDTFNGEATASIQATSSEVDDYLKELEAQIKA